MYSEFISKKNELKKIVEVNICDISTKDFNPRKSGLSQQNVENLVKSEEFPPIHLGFLNEELIVVDGYHRLSATQKMGKDKIEAFITEFETTIELKKQAFLSNVNHGIKLSEFDIALNIYDFYFFEKKQKSFKSLIKIISDYSIPVRRGRRLFFWAILNKEILENNDSEIHDLSKSEEYIKIINKRGEKYESLSLVLKDEIRRFYNKYNYLAVGELRRAVDLYLEGKDYLEEKLKEVKQEELGKTEEIIEFNNDQTEKKEFKNFEENDFIETPTTVDLETGEIKQEKNEEISNNLKTSSPSPKQSNNLSVTNTLNKIGEDVMTIRKLQTLKRITFTEEDYLTLNSLMDRIEDIKSEIDTSSFFNHNEF